MIASLPRPAWLRTATVLYVAAFLVFLFVPLVIVGVFAFNDANYPAPPWRGFTLDWFTGSAATGRVGLFHDTQLLGSIWTSVIVAVWVTILSVTAGTANAFLMERYRFPGKQVLSVLMLTPLVIPGVILASPFCRSRAEWPSLPMTSSASTLISCGPACRSWSWDSFPISLQSRR